MAGVIIAGAVATLFGHFAGISGYNVSDIESLLFIEDSTGIQVGGLLFSGLLIASLGAVMDVAISIASTIEEVHNRRPTLSRMELFQSGMHVGRDTMGTMSTTLILAFAGSSISMLVSYYVYDLPFIQIINSYGMGIEIMQGISGSMGIILTVPLVSAAAAVLMGSPHSTDTPEQDTSILTFPAGTVPAIDPAGDAEEKNPQPAESTHTAPGEKALQITGIQKTYGNLFKRGCGQANPVWHRALAVLQARWRLLATILCLLILTFCALRLFGPLSVYAAGRSDYRAVESAVTKSATSSAAVTDTAAQNTEAFSFDYEKLVQQNPDAVGWLRLPGTAFSYPVVQGKDNDYYLTHTFSRAESPVGAIFLDSRTGGGLSAQHAILYGHNMRDGSMFAALNRFRSQDFYSEHPKLELYTEAGEQDYLVFSAHECEPDSDSYTRDFSDKTGYGAFLDKLEQRSLYDTGISVNPSLPLLTLSTCVDDDRDLRFVVHAQPEKSV